MVFLMSEVPLSTLNPTPKSETLQRYLAHMQQRPTRTLQ
jgi:hypothetical protein